VIYFQRIAEIQTFYQTGKKHMPAMLESVLSYNRNSDHHITQAALALAAVDGELFDLAIVFKIDEIPDAVPQQHFNVFWFRRGHCRPPMTIGLAGAGTPDLFILPNLKSLRNICVF
jgi:hypothetical protein